MYLNFAPISICNVLYKIFSKVLANRLKNVLPQIITEHQSVFTKDRLISDNILLAFESLHCMNKHKFVKGGFMELKLYMSKAYNRVEWPFLECIMRKMGFGKMDYTHDALCVNGLLFYTHQWCAKWVH